MPDTSDTTTLPFDDLAQAIKGRRSVYGYISGLRLDRAAPGEAWSSLPYRPVFVGDIRTGVLHGGVVTSAAAVAKRPGIARQTPRVSLTIRRTALAKRPLGRSELKHFTEWTDGQPATDLNFKFYRQATNKIVGISDQAAAFLGGFFQAQVAL